MKQQSVMKQWVYRVLCVFVGVVFLAGCKSPQNAKDRIETVSVRSTNHTPYNITELYVNGVWAGDSPALGPGSGTVCCAIEIPEHWREGLTAKVRWTHSQAIKDVRGNPIGETVWHEYDAPILPYQQWNTVRIHFLPDHTAKIVVLSAENVSHPPIADPVRPKGWNYPNPDEAYCHSVKLTETTEQECYKKLKELDQAFEGKIPLK